LPALVIGHEAAGGMVRVDLDLGGGRVAALVPREAAEELRVRDGGTLEVVLPPGGLVLARPRRTPDGEAG
ncbi:MAG: TOBE domain-containing protein, partial [Proteobacteria bacterium]|nr:TOBE domain-containing protein [Pseudomonadota bacterium]